jgi:hypothetical protein
MVVLIPDVLVVLRDTRRIDRQKHDEAEDTQEEEEDGCIAVENNVESGIGPRD